MTSFLESSLSFWLLLIFLGFVAALLGAMWASTGRREPLWGAVAAVGLLPVLWIVERLVVTDREAVEATLHEIAADVKSNNRAAVLAHIYSGAPALRQQAALEMPNYSFTECKVNKVHRVKVSASDRPPSAEAEFNVYVSGTFTYAGQTASGDFPRYVALKLRKDTDGKWRVENYTHADPLRGARGGSLFGEQDSPAP
jgi:hypothetical protein